MVTWSEVKLYVQSNAQRTEEVWHKLQTSVKGNMERNTMFGEYMKNKQMCQVHRCDHVMGRDKDCLLSEPVNYDQNIVKPGGWWKFLNEVYRNGIP